MDRIALGALFLTTSTLITAASLSITIPAFAKRTVERSVTLTSKDGRALYADRTNPVGATAATTAY